MRSQGASFHLALFKRQRSKAGKAGADTGVSEGVTTPEQATPAPVQEATAAPEQATTEQAAPVSESGPAPEQAAPEQATTEQTAPVSESGPTPLPEAHVPTASVVFEAATTAQPPADEPVPSEAPAPSPVTPEAAAEAARVSETLPVALEPELRRIIDTAVARVASIELQAIRESRQLTQRTEEESREALKFALDRTQQLVDGFELLTATVAGMISSLRIELESAMKALETADDPYAQLTIDQQPKAAAEPALAPAPTEEAPAPVSPAQPVAQESKPDGPVQGMNGDGPEVHTEPSPEIAEMFREQIINMKNSGKTREEAERTLLRFNLGRRFLGLLDEVYDDDSTASESAPESEQRGRFVRRFFSRQ